jgi:hypothetical protein
VSDSPAAAFATMSPWDMNIFDDDDQDQLITDSRAKIELYQHLQVKMVPHGTAPGELYWPAELPDPVPVSP